MNGSLQFVLVVAMLCLAGSAEATRPSYIGCVTSSECGEGRCCVLGLGRYTYPSCKDLQSSGGSCGPRFTNPVDQNVSYPDGFSILLTNIYEEYCPCKSGLSCDRASATCLPTTA